MQYLQLRVVLLYCNQIIAGITIVWLQQLKVANIATIYCTSVALWLQIFAVWEIFVLVVGYLENNNLPSHHRPVKLLEH